MNQLTKESFVSIIESIRIQRDFDVSSSEIVSEMFRSESIGSYDNSEYLKVIMALLRLHFPVDSDGFCELEHYMFVLDFGKIGEEYESPEELYDRLTSEVPDVLDFVKLRKLEEGSPTHLLLDECFVFPKIAMEQQYKQQAIRPNFLPYEKIVAEAGITTPNPIKYTWFDREQERYVEQLKKYGSDQ